MSVIANQRPAIEAVFGEDEGTETIAAFLSDALGRNLQFFLDGQPVKLVGISRPLGINSRLKAGPGAKSGPLTRPHELIVAVFAAGADNSVSEDDLAALRECHGCVLLTHGNSPTERKIVRIHPDRLNIHSSIWQASLRGSMTTATYVAC